MAAQDRTTALLTAARSALLADATVLASVVDRVFTTAPEGVASPYITIRADYRDSSTSNSEAQDFELEVHCWDIPADMANTKNTSRVRTLMERVRTVFHDSGFSVAGKNVIVSRVTAAVAPVANADEIHGVVIVRVLIGHE